MISIVETIGICKMFRFIQLNSMIQKDFNDFKWFKLSKLFELAKCSDLFN